MNERYARQMSVPGVGALGQQRLRDATVLVVGAGGLGSALLQYLCGAGIGRVVIVDHDRVEPTNLHRQTLFRMSDIGNHKAQAAKQSLQQLNPEVSIDAVCEPLTPANANALVLGADVSVDAADSLAVTYTLSDCCMNVQRPLVSASVTGVAGYVGAFCGGAPSYRAVFPNLPQRLASCAETGVLGSAVGVLGSLQAHVVLALILQIHPSPLGRIVSLDLGTLRFSDFSFMTAHEPQHDVARFIAEAQISTSDYVVDLRSESEAAAPIAGSIRRRLDDVEDIIARVRPSQRVVLCCRSGVRAWRAAEKLRAAGLAHLALLAVVN